MSRSFCVAVCILSLLTGTANVSAQGDLALRDEVAPNLESRTVGEKSELPELRLTGTDVTAEALEQLAGSHWGRVLLIDARFDGEIIEALRKAKSIASLRLSGVGLSGQISRIRNVKGLQSLGLSTPLTVRDLEAVGRLDDLQELSLPQELPLTVTAARAVARLTNLTTLRLYGVDVDDASFKEFKTLSQLVDLDLSHTRVTDEGLTTLLAMPHLRRLELYRPPQWHIEQQIGDACVPTLVQLSELERLSLSGEISDTGLVEIAKLPHLKSLSLLNTRITASGLAALRDSTVEQLCVTPDQIGLALAFRLQNERNAAHASMPGAANLRECARLRHVTIIGNATMFPDLETLQQVAPGIGWGFIDP